MALMDTLTRWVTGRNPQRSDLALSFNDWANYFSFNGSNYALNQTIQGINAPIGQGFENFVQGAYKANGIVYACIQARLMLLSQARFQFQELRKGVPGDLFGTADLAPLERPEPGKVTADLIARASVDVDLAGNSFIVRRATSDGVRLKRLRPDWVDIVMGSKSGLWVDATVIGYTFYPEGRHSGVKPELFLAEEVAHFAPIPDPLHRFRGMSWLTPIIRDIQADSSATSHKELFFENGATPNMVVTVTANTPEKFNEIVDLIEQGHTGRANAYKTLYLATGTTAEVVGSNLQQIEFSATQGAGETRIASAAGIHPVILGLSEGLAGSSLNQGNFMAARRLAADMTLRPWWGGFAASMEVIVPPPGASRLWYDDRHIPFLAEDVKDAAEVLSTNATAINTLTVAGFEPDAVIDAVTAGDLGRLKGTHSGLFSVQLQPPGTTTPDPTPDPNAPPDLVPVVTPNA